MAQAGIAVYCFTAALCGWAYAAGRAREFGKAWLAAAAFFLALAAIRLLDGEEILRQTLRESLETFGNYSDRQILQVPLATIVIVMTLWLAKAALDIWRERHGSRHEFLVRIAHLAMLGFLPLYALRLISWHPIDSFLYAEPVHPNWLIDGGLTAVVALAAIISARRG